jgi:hypothetical protein
MEPLWSPWPQPVAVARKSTGGKDPENKAKSVAVESRLQKRRGDLRLHRGRASRRTANQSVGHSEQVARYGVPGGR